MRHSALAAFALFCALPLAAQLSFNNQTYTAPTGTNQRITTIADLDRDGNPDLITTDNANSRLLIRYGTGNGQYGGIQVIPLGFQPVDVKAGDFNGDGNLDLVVSGSTSSNTAVIAVLKGFGNRTFSTSTFGNPEAAAFDMAVGDFNGDGKLDFAVAVSSRGFSAIQIYDGNGDGTFSAGTQLIDNGSTRLIAADLNKDGKTDLVSIGGMATIFLNNGDGTFRTAQTINSPNPNANFSGGDLADLNGDAAPDLVLSVDGFCGQGCGYVELLVSYLNDGAGHFTLKQQLPATHGNADNVMLGDISYDGRVDLIYADLGNGGPIAYALGNGDGTFQTDQQLTTLAQRPEQLLLRDLNNDGQLDIVAEEPTALQVELNTTAKPDCSSPNSSTLAAHVCAPASGATVNSPFHVRATANSPTDVQRIEEWLDGKKINQQFGNQLRSSITASAGTHTLTIIPVDIFGNFVKQNLTIHVGSGGGCSAPSSPGVRICSPASGATVNSPVAVSAAATATSGTHITAMRLYVDNVSKFTVNGANLSTSVALPAGAHNLSVVGYESNGAALKTSEQITVH